MRSESQPCTFPSLYDPFSFQLPSRVAVWISLCDFLWPRVTTVHPEPWDPVIVYVIMPKTGTSLLWTTWNLRDLNCLCNENIKLMVGCFIEFKGRILVFVIGGLLTLLTSSNFPIMSKAPYTVPSTSWFWHNDKWPNANSLETFGDTLTLFLNTALKYICSQQFFNPSLFFQVSSVHLLTVWDQRYICVIPNKSGVVTQINRTWFRIS